MADTLPLTGFLDNMVTIIASIALLGKLRKSRDLFHTSTEIVTVGGFAIVGVGKQKPLSNMFVVQLLGVAAFTSVNLETHPRFQSFSSECCSKSNTTRSIGPTALSKCFETGLRLRGVH